MKSTSHDVRFAAAVAGFGQLMRADPYLKGFTLKDVASLASSNRGDDKFGYRAEFIQLVKLAEGLPAMPTQKPLGTGGE